VVIIPIVTALGGVVLSELCGIGMAGGYRTDCHRLRWSTSGHGCRLCPVATSWHGAIVLNVATL
jgi:hypothetical protein